MSAVPTPRGGDALFARSIVLLVFALSNESDDSRSSAVSGDVRRPSIRRGRHAALFLGA